MQYIPDLLFNSVLKTAFLISDVLITVLLYKTVLEITKNKSLAEKAALIWFLNPFVIWISAGWGMWDTLPALFSLACFYFLLKKRYALSAVSLSLGVATKLYPVLFLVPVTFFLLHSSPNGENRKNILKFFGVFAAVSALLLVPYIGEPTPFMNFFLPNSVAVSDPVVEPVGFGLTYWSLYLLNRLVNAPISVAFVSFASLASVVLVAVFLALAFWRTSKLTFKSPAFDLNASMLLCILAVFLSVRTICEQWLIWALPPLVLLYVTRKVKPAIYWGVSALALLYGILNTPLPLFFLPSYPWIGNSLLSMMYVWWTVEPFVIALLAVLGCVFSFLVLMVLLKLAKKSEAQQHQTF